MNRRVGLYNERVNEPGGRENLSEAQREEIKEVFTLFDADKDGFLDVFELRFAMKALGFEAHKAEVLQIIKSHARPGRRQISFEDFYQVLGGKIAQRDPREELRRAFKLFDSTNAGKIGFQDLKRAATEIGEMISDQDLQAMIDVFDLDEDGYINEEEFIQLCQDL